MTLYDMTSYHACVLGIALPADAEYSSSVYVQSLLVHDHVDDTIQPRIYAEPSVLLTRMDSLLVPGIVGTRSLVNPERVFNGQIMVSM